MKHYIARIYSNLVIFIKEKIVDTHYTKSKNFKPAFNDFNINRILPFWSRQCPIPDLNYSLTNPTQAIDKIVSNIDKKEWLDDEEELTKILRNEIYDNVSIKYIMKQKFRIYNRWGGAKKIWCFGCSETFGLGLPDEETWPWLLQIELGSKEFTAHNFGVSGASSDYMCRIIYTLLNTTKKPEIIACLFPDIYRKEYFTETGECVYLNPQLHKRVVSSFLKKNEYESYINLSNKYESFLNFVKNIKFIQLMCKFYNIKFVWHTWSLNLLNLPLADLQDHLGDLLEHCPIKNETLYNINDIHNLHDVRYKARDGRHNGVQYNKILVNEFARLINQIQ